MLGFAAGVMLAASFWSLLARAVLLSEGGTLPVWVPATVGFLVGVAVLMGVDWVLHQLRPRVILATLKELIPESMNNANADLAIVAGFAVLMVLDVALG